MEGRTHRGRGKTTDRSTDEQGRPRKNPHRKKEDTEGPTEEEDTEGFTEEEGRPWKDPQRKKRDHGKIYR